MTAISVITIVYNDAKVLPRAAKSVFGQSFRDYEYLVINDGSTDETDKLIDRLAASDKRLTPFHLKNNIGRAGARNTGLEHAKGKYLFFLDADDFLPENALQNLYSIAEEDQADIVYGATVNVERGSETQYKKNYRYKVMPEVKRKITLKDYPQLLHNNSVINCLYRSEFIKEHKIKFSLIRKNGEDVLFAFYTAFYASRISLAADVVTYIYSTGNYLGAASLSKLDDAKNNMIETKNFVMSSHEESLKKEMFKKCAGYGADLLRAEKVYPSRKKLKKYIKTLYPLYEGMPDDITLELPRKIQKFTKYMMRRKAAAALNIWMRKKDYISPVRIAMAEEILKIKNKIDNAIFRVISCLDHLQPRISIIVPVYNGEKWLDDCLKSIVAQTLKKIEIICVNDASTDHSLAILEKYKSANDNFYIIDRHENGGLAAARNSGIRVARGKYLYFIDADDMLFDADSLKHLYQIARETGSDEIIGATYKWHEESAEIYTGNHAAYLKQELRKVTLAQHPELKANAVAWNKLIKRQFLIREGILLFNERLRRYEDNPYSAKVHLLAKKISVTVRPTYVFRQPPEDINYFLTKIIPYRHYHFVAIEEITRFLEERNISPNPGRRAIESTHVTPLLLAAQNYVAGKMDKRQLMEIYRDYQRAFKKLPQEALNEFPESVRVSMELWETGKSSQALKKLTQKKPSYVSIEVSTAAGFLPLFKQRFPAVAD